MAEESGDLKPASSLKYSLDKYQIIRNTQKNQSEFLENKAAYL